MIRFYTLGSLDLRAVDGRQLRSVLAQPKRVALLAYLAVAGKGDSHRRDTLLGLFWPDLDEGRARHALNQSLYVLRRALGASVFVSTGDEELSLDPAAMWCDVGAFLEATEAGRAAEALEHYRGDLLDGFFISDAPEFEKWLDTERDGLRRTAASAAWGLAEAAESAGQVAEAAEWARQAADFSVDDESTLRRLIVLLDRLGDRASAVRAYKRFASRLHEELGVEPSPETQSVIAGIRARETPASEGSAARTPESASGEARGTGPSRTSDSARGGPSKPADIAAPGPAEDAAPALGEFRDTEIAPASPAGSGAGVGEIWEAIDARPRVQLGTGTRAGGPSVAVLPFVDMSAGSDEEYFGDGMTEELIAALAKVEGLRVAARTSAFQFKETSEDIRTIGERLNVGAALEGSIRREGERVRITAKLIDVGDGFQIWSEVYDRELADIFAVQEEIARTIVDELRVELLGEPERPLVRAHSASLEAYTLYLKGRYLWNQRTADGLRASIECFEEAIAADDRYAQAYAGLADAYSLLGWYRYLSSEEAYSRIGQAAERALELQGREPEACTSHAYAKFLYEWDFAGAEAEFQRALEVGGNYPTLHHWYGEYLMAMGRLEEAHEHLLRAHELDPLNLTITVGLGWSHYFLGEYDKAIERYESVRAMDPEFVIVPWFLGPAYVQAGRHEDALELYSDWIGRLGEHPGLVALMAQAHALAGRPEEAREVYGQLEERARRAPIFPDYHALVHTALGEADEAFGWLEKALEERVWVLVFLKVDPAYENLRSDPRCEPLLERIGLVA